MIRFFLQITFLVIVQFPVSVGVVSIWKTEHLNIHSSLVSIHHHNTFVLAVNSNGPLQSSSRGHYSLRLTIHSKISGRIVGKSACLNFMGHTEDIKNSLLSTAVNFSNNSLSNFLLSDVADVSVERIKEYRKYNNYNTTMRFHFISQPETNISVLAVFNGCTPLRTIRKWEDSSSWTNGLVPNASVDTVFPICSGVIEIQGDKHIKSIHMEDGLLQLHKSSCPEGWVPLLPLPKSSVTSIRHRKCIFLINKGVTKEEAAEICKDSGPYATADSQLAAHLLQIESSDEQRAAQLLCRGPRGTAANDLGCWIGLSGLNSGASGYTWDHPVSLVDGSFRDWRRYEPSNFTFADSPPQFGAACVHLVRSRDDPMLLASGSWKTDACDRPRAALCELLAPTVDYSLTVAERSVLAGGGLQGGVLKFLAAVQVSNFSVSQARLRFEAPTTANPTSRSSLSGPLSLSQGSSLSVTGGVNLLAPGQAGGTDDGTGELHFENGVYLSCRSPLLQQSSCEFNISSPVNISGSLTVSSAASLNLKQGGHLSQADLVLASHSTLLLGEYAVSMFDFDSFLLNLQLRGRYSGESVNRTDANANRLHQSSLPIGVYRLEIRESGGSSATQQTSCIPFDASSETLTAALNELHLVASRGGVSVRRYGDGDAKSRFGYSHIIDFDSIGNTSRHRSVAIGIACYGFQCGCAETQVPLVDSTGLRMCPTDPSSFISPSDANICVTPPILSTSRRSSLSTITTTTTPATAQISVLSSVHRFSPSLHCKVHIIDGVAVVAADQITWDDTEVVSNGIMVVGGTGWRGWESAVITYGYWNLSTAYTNSTPTFQLSLKKFLLSNTSILHLVGPGSNVTFVTGTWAGGTIGGSVDVTVRRELVMAGASKYLRFGLNLLVPAASRLNWLGGNLTLFEGATLIIKGIFSVDIPGGSRDQHLLGQSALSLPVVTGVIAWLSVYNFNVPSPVWMGWFYHHPVCGIRCWTSPLVIIYGSLAVGSGSAVTFDVPVLIKDRAQMSANTSSTIRIHSGGSCGFSSSILLKRYSTLQLTGGILATDAACKIRGDGDVLVTDGSHELPSKIQVHTFTATGGRLLWPLRRGDRSSVEMFGDLYLNDTALLQFEPLRSNMTVHNSAHLSQQSVVQFPMIGIAAEPTPFDRLDIPDLYPGGTFWVNNYLRWNGGTLIGKADFRVHSCYLGGDVKRIRFLSRLVNNGHCEWGSGDIHADYFGDFVNLGSVQMEHGYRAFEANNYLEGSVIPVEDGGDSLALDYHAWDVDPIGLDYTEYVSLQ